ncbi:MULTISPECIES: SPFH domain-containing protein [unclassified Colwellia]|uniref:SPFH domain-containing protein n=1 Tax=unclassified Colwellia TaxID=196834 RepID=UPI0015F59A40|nr:MULTISPECIES: stomatin-like protein [unclassified Colwellia]MBA6232329.1 paraslipin [Colwellia sp. MB02u-7]MBA6236005.1 paraslipin [Colwellia sp. MB02u-11]MBA6256741.1 paraslipin [Colwellia sp. MB3u-28]MBA6261456.1 paraslipin [Colwellia sp. MB3u-41]MBA6298590.1 paraslipin [Colwellia sp. MB3u-22]
MIEQTISNIGADSNLDIVILAIWGAIFIFLAYKFVQAICLVPTKSAYVVERLGKYRCTLEAGFHILLPFIDRVAFIQDLKEETIDVPPQECFSKDEVNVEVDGVIYIEVIDSLKASYGITDYRFAAMQLAQTTTRSVIGTLDLDRTFEERDIISAKVVEVLDKAGESWGIRVHRYEIKNITPPDTVKNAMELQVNAERERRAILAKSLGDKASRINRSEGLMTEMINISEGEKQRRINSAEGKAAQIIAIAQATGDSITKIAIAIEQPGGQQALDLQLTEQYLQQMQGLSQANRKVILPANLLDFNQWLSISGIK